MKWINKIKTFAIETLGCKVNLYESNIIRNELLSLGIIEVPFSAKADLYIVNSCSVTNVADSKSRYTINKARRTNPASIILVCGCFSQVNQQIENADIILGNKYKANISNVIEAYFNNYQEKLIKVDNLLLEKDYEFSAIDYYKEHTRAFLKIQEGCNFMCSYCIIPFSRGRQRSKHHENVLTEIQNLVNSGYKEIVLTGVNTAGYLDSTGVDFYQLLLKIHNLPGEFRIRISSVEPFQITDPIIELISKNPTRFCQHWHICLQSGSNEILHSMNRKYTTFEFQELVNKIYKLNPWTSITTDYICGFPGETNEDHKTSLEFCKQIGFYQMHIFPFSERKNTKAVWLKNKVSEQIKKARVHDFLELNKELEKTFVNKFLNQEVEVLIEKNIGENKYIGKTSQYFSVIVEANQGIINEIWKVKIEKIVANIVFGKIIEKIC